MRITAHPNHSTNHSKYYVTSTEILRIKTLGKGTNRKNLKPGSKFAAPYKETTSLRDAIRKVRQGPRYIHSRTPVYTHAHINAHIQAFDTQLSIQLAGGDRSDFSAPGSHEVLQLAGGGRSDFCAPGAREHSNVKVAVTLNSKSRKNKPLKKVGIVCHITLDSHMQLQP